MISTKPGKNLGSLGLFALIGFVAACADFKGSPLDAAMEKPQDASGGGTGGVGASVGTGGSIGQTGAGGTTIAGTGGAASGGTGGSATGGTIGTGGRSGTGGTAVGGSGGTGGTGTGGSGSGGTAGSAGAGGGGAPGTGGAGPGGGGPGTGGAGTGGSPAAIPPPRLISPLSTATVTRRRPILRWSLTAGTDGAHIQICADRACATEIISFDASGSEGVPTRDLPTGVLFWRAYGRTVGATGSTPTPTWQFIVGAGNPALNTSWGTTLDVNGDGYADVLVGAGGVNTNTGRAYLYLGSPSGLNTTPAVALTGPDGTDGRFGFTVASAGDVNGDGYADVIVGALNVDSNTGRIYLYLGGPSGLSASPAATIIGPDGPGGYFGTLASAGDVNRDGYADVVVAAPGINSNTGRVYVYFGDGTGLSSYPSVVLTGPDGPNGSFGASVASAGDMNADGYADIVVGAAGVESNTGRAYVYRGGAVGPSVTPSGTFAGPDGPMGFFGDSVAGAGDVNCDGLADVIVGAFEAGGSAIGRAYIYLGGLGPVSTSPSRALIGPGSETSFFGLSVATAGDVNKDGCADVVVGAEVTGKAYVYHGSSLGPSDSPSTTLDDPQPGMSASDNGFGVRVNGAGDVNGDGHDDVIVGASGFNSNTGRVYLYAGSSSGLPSSPSLTLMGPDGQSGMFGISLAGVGR